MVDRGSYQIYFFKIYLSAFLSKKILVHYIGAIVIYIQHIQNPLGWKILGC